MVTRGAVPAPALLLAVVAVEPGAARRFAQKSRPSDRTLALAVGVGARAAVLASAHVTAIVSVASVRARLFAIASNVTFYKF